MAAATSKVDLEQNQSLSIEEIKEKIKSISDLQIELIGRKIARQILNNLGPTNKLRVSRQMTKDHEIKDEFMLMMRVMESMNANVEIENKKQSFLSDLQGEKFIRSILVTIKKEIKSTLSFTDAIFQYGVYIPISDYEPEEFIGVAGKEVGVKLSLIDVPPKYSIILKVDLQKSKEKGELFFILTELSDGTQFSKTSFLLSDLK